ncbi:hypothetical protein KIN20_027971 [Parelaphostrongylus tenuis]|uniref:glucuronosyltransferase n=1 Tax=Parelaphostrongylus tenuis TaxID=148309 RepID=A0AAD5R0D0_PARTN|nr:hypothetical protein KIN20_027971 [Parelaphostrongylus tenuis]
MSRKRPRLMKVAGILLVVSLSYELIDAFNYLVVSPLFGHSHANFMGTIADTLTEAGHNVTVLMPILNPDMEHQTGLRKTMKVIKVSPDNRTAALFRREAELMELLWGTKTTPFNMVELASYMIQCFTYQCEKVFNDDEVMNVLSEQQFDVGIAEAIDICGFGVFELLNVKATIASWSGAYLELLAKAVGIPGAASYVPGMMSAKGDVMGIFERLKNVLEILIGSKFFEQMFERENSCFSSKIWRRFQRNFFPKCPTCFTNSNPYIDYPHPTIHKNVDIGGITVSPNRENIELPKSFDDILNEQKTNVIISFGTVIKASHMPENYRYVLD